MIVVMDKGAIVEQGTHEDLMRIRGGTYRQLYEELRGSVQEEPA
jgi:ABC-type multidrug transport system fused ATPase/permease subunit